MPMANNSPLLSVIILVKCLGSVLQMVCVIIIVIIIYRIPHHHLSHNLLFCFHEIIAIHASRNCNAVIT